MGPVRSSSLILVALVSAALGGCGRIVVPLEPSAKLVELQISCAQNNVPANIYVPCEVVGLYSDNSIRNVSLEAQWLSGDASVLETSSQSQTSWFRGLNPGSASITAKIGSVQTTFNINVTVAVPVSVSITPANQSFRSGTNQQFGAVCIFSDNTFFDVTQSAAWTVVDSNIGTITNGQSNAGLFSAVGVGTTQVQALFEGVQGSTQVSVTSKILMALLVSPNAQSVINGLSAPFTAQGIYTDLSTSDLTSTVTWSVLDGTVGSISNAVGQEGLFTGFQAGSTRVRATVGGFSDDADITVTSPTLTSVTVAPVNPSLAAGLSQFLTATGHYSDGSSADVTSVATWASNATGFATVNNVGAQKGRVTAVAIGSANISATYGGFSGQTTVTVLAPELSSITVTPSASSLAKGLTAQYTATGNYTDGSTTDITSSVTWSTTTASIATVSNAGGSRGVVTAVGLGTTAVIATSGLVSGQTNITVTSPALTSVTVTPANPSVAAGLSQFLTATGNYSDGSSVDITSVAVWASDATGVATVSNAAGLRGRVTAVAIGTANISATYNGVLGQTAVTVVAPELSSITVTPAAASLAKGLTSQYVATGNYSDGSTMDITSSVTWSTGNGSTATVSNAGGSRGVVTAAGLGTTTVIATSGLISGQTNITVTAAALVSIAVTPANSTIIFLMTVQFTATGTYTDGTQVNLTESVTWHSSSTLTATVSNTAGQRGRASGAGVGSTTITATHSGGISGFTQLNGVL